MAKNFLKVACSDCGNETTIFSRATSVVSCSICGATLSKPSGGKAALVGCTVVEALE
ncbi:MAG: 30S ribosomal protein S27e [Candidatus Poseidoniaceae archaeon]